MVQYGPDHTIWLGPYFTPCNERPTSRRGYLGIEVDDALKMAEQTEV